MSAPWKEKAAEEAALVAALRAEVDRLRAALRGLRFYPDGCWCFNDRDYVDPARHSDACNAARAALAKGEP